MHIYEFEADMVSYLKSKKKVGSTIGLVPTMGALHEGHLSLLHASREQNDISVVSIFVNPLQFNNKQDLVLYPRPLQEDCEMLQEFGCDIVFTPSATEMYPCAPIMNLNFGFLEDVMEGKYRPGHFSGVGTVVAKLFNIIQPDKAYFGQKDLQQCMVTSQLVKDLSFPVELVQCPIIREANGLAMSSRNRRIPASKITIATKLYEALQLAKQELIHHTPLRVKELVGEFLSLYPELHLEYFEMVDGETFMEVNHVPHHATVALCIAAYLDEVRLIDNMVFNPAIPS